MNQKIIIVDYGMANLRSVQKALEKMGAAADISGDPQRLAEADKMVLPGVGAFRDAIARLHDAGLAEPIRSPRSERQTVLRHLPGPAASVHQKLRGRRLYRSGSVSRRRGPLSRSAGPQGAAHGLESAIHQDGPLRTCGICRADPSVYFVHSYYVVPKDANIVATETDYGTPFTSAIWCDNVFATQFHPEKSQNVGMQNLKNFAGL